MLCLPFEPVIGMDSHERMKYAFSAYLRETAERYMRPVNNDGSLAFHPMEYEIWCRAWRDSVKWNTPIKPYTPPPRFDEREFDEQEFDYEGCFGDQFGLYDEEYEQYVQGAHREWATN